MKKNSILKELDWYSHQTINPTFNEIAKYLKKLKNSDKIPNINEVAENSFTTDSSITRFCKQIGYSGYKEFINKLFIEFELSSSNDDQNIKSTWTDDLIYNKSFEGVIQKFYKANEQYYNSIIKIAQEILLRDRIYLFSCELTNAWINMLYNELINMGFNVYLLNVTSNIVNLFEKGVISSNSAFIGLNFQKNYLAFSESVDFLKNHDTFLGLICSSNNALLLEQKPDVLISLDENFVILSYILIQIINLVKNKK